MRQIQIIITAELFATSLWFSANAVAPQLHAAWNISVAEIGNLTTAVQSGFIAGTLFLAVSGLADRYPACRIFFVAAIGGATANALFAWHSDAFTMALLWRFLTGVALAGLYPIGMKLVVSWHPEKSAENLAWLVGMLTLGTGIPHLIQSLNLDLPWRLVVTISSILSVVSGTIILWLGDGPHGRTTSALSWKGVKSAFRIQAFRTAAFAYFGHMWELYAFWVMVPYIVEYTLTGTAAFSTQNVSWISFNLFLAGAIGCIWGGRASRVLGSRKVASIALAVSALMCLLFPLLFHLHWVLSLLLLCFWGMAVVADSPQFSALASRGCPPEIVGGALSVMNSLGFLITLFTIELAAGLWNSLHLSVSWILLPGPVIGLWLLNRAQPRKPDKLK